MDLFLEVVWNFRNLALLSVCIGDMYFGICSVQEHSSALARIYSLVICFAQKFGGDRSSGGLVESHLYLHLLKSVWLALEMMTHLKDLFGIIGTGINLRFVCICSGVCSILRKSVSSEVCSGLQKELVQHLFCEGC